jgi:hypothetical protein
MTSISPAGPLGSNPFRCSNHPFPDVDVREGIPDIVQGHPVPTPLRGIGEMGLGHGHHRIRTRQTEQAPARAASLTTPIAQQPSTALVADHGRYQASSPARYRAARGPVGLPLSAWIHRWGWLVDGVLSARRPP